MLSKGISRCKGSVVSKNSQEGLVLTSSLTGIGEDNDVIKGPGVVGMRWVEGKLGCPLSP
jgi:hypothetical protein